MCDHLQTFTGHREPATSLVINSFAKWLMINPSPSPTWLAVDGCRRSVHLGGVLFCMNSGIGLMTAPAEAHWIMGAEEGAIGILNASVKRLLNDEACLTVENAFALAAHGANHTIGPSGFSTFQWRSYAPRPDPFEIGATSSFWRRAPMARIAFEQEHAKYKLSKLSNALGRSPASFKSSDLVMIWRRRIKPGKTTSHGKAQFAPFYKRAALSGWAAGRPSSGPKPISAVNVQRGRNYRGLSRASPSCNSLSHWRLC